MFDGLVSHYDVLNSVLSLGLDRRWRRAVATAIRARPRERVLDLGCGTGELGLAVDEGANVVGVDVSHPMLLAAGAKGRESLSLVQGSAFRLPFADGTFDAAVSAFVLRNIDDLGAAFVELGRVLRPQGRVALLDVTGPAHRLVRPLFHLYFDTVAPALGALVGRRDAYRYLVRSLAHLPSPEEICGLLGTAGFEACSTRAFTVGVATMFTGRRAGNS